MTRKDGEDDGDDSGAVGVDLGVGRDVFSLDVDGDAQSASRR